MGLKKTLCGFILLFFLMGLVFAGTEYKLDKAHSSVSFTIRHMVVSKVRGNFKEFSVAIAADEDLTKWSVTAVIKAASIDTDNKKRDDHLRSADFFDVAKFPEITFKTTAIKKMGDNYVAHGQLTMHGVTKDMEVPFEVLGEVEGPGGKTRMGIEAKTKLDRKDYGLTWNRTMDKGGLVVGNEVKIEILLELVGQKEK